MNFKQLFIIIFSTVIISSCSSGDDSYDIVIYGGTSAGVIAAVQAKKSDKSVVLVGPDVHLGGLTSSGLGWTDSGRKEAVGGLSRGFYQRVRSYYEQDSVWKFQDRSDYNRMQGWDDAMWVFEPHIAENVFEDLIEEYNIEVYRDHWLDRENGVVKEGNKIVSIKTINGKEFKGKIFIDATYEGDLFGSAGVSYTVGRESNSMYNETLNGVQKKHDQYHQFELEVSPYVIAGDSTSGLLPRIHDEDPGEDGEGDDKIQAYNYRLCMTQVPENRVKFPKPDNYDPLQYELLGRYFDAGFRKLFNKFDPIPNKKTDTNNSGGFSTDNIGMNYDYPEASYEERKVILKEHEDYQKGLFWFMAYDERVPADVRDTMSTWGLAKDEFQDNGNWPHQIYVREARRMVSDFVMNENHLRGKIETPESIGMGSYNMDSHHTQRYVDERGFARNEGDVQISPGRAYEISYRAIVPKKEECGNLLVPVCLSSSHIAYGSIRMEPVFMILAQSAVLAANIAIDGDKDVQEVEYSELRPLLEKENQVMELD